jgi:hypothetical protein
MKLSLDEDNYNDFNDFFIEGLRGKISQEEFAVSTTFKILELFQRN